MSTPEEYFVPTFAIIPSNCEDAHLTITEVDGDSPFPAVQIEAQW
jgi:hypothetical protein